MVGVDTATQCGVPFLGPLNAVAHFGAGLVGGEDYREYQAAADARKAQLADQTGIGNLTDITAVGDVATIPGKVSNAMGNAGAYVNDVFGYLTD